MKLFVSQYKLRC